MFQAAPLALGSYKIADKLGVKKDFRIRFDTVWLTIRSATPDFKVVRSCLLGEFNEPLRLTRVKHGLLIDAGGYIGLVSILMAMRFPDAQIVCLEPHPDNFRLAKKNCAPWTNIEVLQCALGAEAGEHSIRDRGTGEWGYTIVADPDDAPNSTVVGATRTVSICQLIGKYHASGVDLLKLDIEGGEYEILQRASEWMDRCDVLVVELHERIRKGVDELYQRATRDRFEVKAVGEKRLSMSASAYASIDTTQTNE